MMNLIKKRFYFLQLAAGSFILKTVSRRVFRQDEIMIKKAWTGFCESNKLDSLTKDAAVER